MEWVRIGRIDSSKVINLKVLWDSNIVGKFKFGVKLLAEVFHSCALLFLFFPLLISVSLSLCGLAAMQGSETVDRPLHIKVTHASENAREAVESQGGSVEYVWFNRVTLRAHLMPHKFKILPHSDGIPPPRLYKRYPHLAPEHSFRHMEDQETAVKKYEFVPDYLQRAAELHAKEKAEKEKLAKKKAASLS